MTAAFYRVFNTAGWPKFGDSRKFFISPLLQLQRYTIRTPLGDRVIWAVDSESARHAVANLLGIPYSRTGKGW